jgi:hypothetical protein
MTLPCGLGLPPPFWAMLFSLYPTLQECALKKNKCEKCFCHLAVQECSAFYLLWRALPICMQDVFLA